MAEILVDADTFDADVTVPQDGDSRNAASVKPAFQKLSNRTRYAYNRVTALQQFASFSVSGGAVSSGNKHTLTELADPSAAFSVAANEIVFPAVGWYLVQLYVQLTSADATNPQTLSTVLMVDGIVKGVGQGKRFSGTVGDFVVASSHCLLEVTDIVAQKLSLVTTVAGVTVTAGSDSRIFVQRLR